MIEGDCAKIGSVGSMETKLVISYIIKSQALEEDF